MSVKKRRRLPNFEARSVALFAALALTGGSTASRLNSASAGRTMNTAYRAVADSRSPAETRWRSASRNTSRKRNG